MTIQIMTIQSSSIRKNVKAVTEKYKECIECYVEKFGLPDGISSVELLFALSFDKMNYILTGEKASEIKERWSVEFGRTFDKKKDLIRDYFSVQTLEKYFYMTDIAKTLIAEEELNPLDAVQKASRLMPYNNFPEPVNLVKYI